MIDRTHRFHGHGSLRFVYQKGETVRGTYGVLRYKPNNRRTRYRLAVVVSRKVSKSAVVRNRIRRRIYEISRECLKNVSTPYDMVMTIYCDVVAGMDYQELQQRVRSYFERAGILSTEENENNTRSDDIVESKENRK